MDFDKYLEHIKKTGFELEYRVSALLREHNWGVLNHRYYIDDIVGTAREIDVVAYKTRMIGDFRLYTGLIISCKKSEKDLWAFLAKARNLRDANIDWKPYHVWTNHKALQYMLEKCDWRKDYHKSAAEGGVKRIICYPDAHIFAFQEMNKHTGKTQNQRNIYDSVSSLMKAQAYELSSLPSRKKEKSLYQFNLLSIIDSQMIRLLFEDDEITATEVDNDHYIAQYIVNREETSAKIHFITAEAFAEIINDYDSLQVYNEKFFRNLYNKFYEDVFTDWDKEAIFKEDFSKRFHRHLSSEIHGGKKISFYFSLREEEGSTRLAIELFLPKEHLMKMNADKALIENVKKDLQAIFHYTGDFEFVESDIPF